MNAKGINERCRFTLMLLGLIMSCNGWGAVADVLDDNARGLLSAPQSTLNETPSPATLEASLERLRVTSRRQAAEASFKLSVIAANREDYKAANTLIEEEIALDSRNPDYLRAAAGIALGNSDYDKAEEYQERVLEIARSAFDPDDLRLAAILDELGMVYFAQTRYSEAESLLKQSLVIRERNSGKMHPSLAASLNDLAGFAMKDERFDEAEQLLRRAIHILETSLGMDHLETVMAVHNLGDLYANQKRLSEAEALYQRAFLVWAAAPAKDRLELAASLNELGSFYHSRNRLDEAKAQFGLVTALLKGDIGQDHPYAKTARAGLERLKAEHKKRSQGEEVSQKIFDELQTRLSSHY